MSGEGWVLDQAGLSSFCAQADASNSGVRIECLFLSAATEHLAHGACCMLRLAGSCVSGVRYSAFCDLWGLDGWGSDPGTAILGVLRAIFV